MAGTLKSGMWWLHAMDEKWYGRIRPRLTRGRRVPLATWPKPVPIFVYKEVGSRPDVASTMGEPIRVVSSELRRVIESIDAQAAQFLPIEVKGPRRGTIAKKYWMVNWLRTWDCLSSPDAMSFDPARIPACQRLGVAGLKQRGLDGAIVCDSTLKKLATTRGVVGLKFSPVPVASGPLGKGHYYDKRRKRIAIERQCLPGDVHFDVDEFLRRFPGTSFPDQREGSNALYEYMFTHQGPEFSLRTLRKLLDAGYSPNTTNTIDPPIPVFFHPRSPSVLRLLHQHGVDWNLPNMIGLTPLMSAAMDGEPRRSASCSSSARILTPPAIRGPPRCITRQKALRPPASGQPRAIWTRSACSSTPVLTRPFATARARLRRIGPTRATGTRQRRNAAGGDSPTPLAWGRCKHRRRVIPTALRRIYEHRHALPLTIL